MDPVETVSLGEFEYGRYELRSSACASAGHFGVIRPAGMASSQIQGTIYFFHGGDSDDRQVIGAKLFESLSQANRAKLLAAKFQIVCPFVGTSMLHATSSSSGNNYAAAFFDSLLSLAEKDTATINATRFLSGVSMGGTAAFNALVQRPHAFAGLAALAPALFDLDFWSASEVERYVHSTGANSGYMTFIAGLIKAEFAGLQDFLSASPLALLPQTEADYLRGKKLYFSVGDRDEFGLLEGTNKLSAQLFARDLRHEYRIIQGAKHDLGYAIPEFERAVQFLLA